MSAANWTKISNNLANRRTFDKYTTIGICEKLCNIFLIYGKNKK